MVLTGFASISNAVIEEHLCYRKLKYKTNLLKSDKIFTYLATASESPFDSRRRLYNNNKCELIQIYMQVNLQFKWHNIVVASYACVI